MVRLAGPNGVEDTDGAGVGAPLFCGAIYAPATPPPTAMSAANMVARGTVSHRPFFPFFGFGSCDGDGVGVIAKHLTAIQLTTTRDSATVHISTKGDHEGCSSRVPQFNAQHGLRIRPMNCGSSTDPGTPCVYLGACISAGQRARPLAGDRLIGHDRRRHTSTYRSASGSAGHIAHRLPMRGAP